MEAAPNSSETGFRAWMNRNPAIVIAALALLVVGVLLASRHRPPTPKAFYSIDDGATYFAHDYAVPPFTHKGQEAVQAWVYTCDDGQTQFVGYLMRFSPEGKEAMNKLLADRRAHHASGPLVFPAGVEVKRPGSGEWVARGGAAPNSSGSAAAIERGKRIGDAIRAGAEPSAALTGGVGDDYQQITTVKCPGGGKVKPTVYDPP